MTKSLINNSYPIDIWGIKKIGVETWLDNYYIPVLGEEYSKIYEYVIHKYIQIFCNKSLDNRKYLIGVANIKICKIITNFIFQLIRIERLSKNGYIYLIGKEITKIEDIQHKFSNVYVFYESFFWNQQTSRTYSIYSIIFSLLKKILNKHLTIGFNFGSYPEEMKVYCKEMNIIPAYFYRYSFAKRHKHFSSSSLFYKNTCKLVNNISNHYPIIIPHVKNLIQEITTFLKNSEYLFNNSLFYLKRFNLGSLLASGSGSPVNRIIIAAWKEAGGKTVGFPHGNTYATCYDKIHIDSDALSIVSELFASSKGQAKLLNKLKCDHSRGLKLAQVTFPKKSLYISLFNQKQKEPPVKKIKRVMILGYPMNTVIYPSFFSQHSFANLKLELTLCRILKENNYFVIYKAHPDRWKEVEFIFNNFTDKIIIEPFEKCYSLADCIVFSYSRTTTFGFALLTKKPIVLVNLNEIMWDNYAFKLTSKRCQIVNAVSNDNDEILFNKKEFLNAIEASVTTICYDVVHKFAL